MSLNKLQCTLILLVGVVNFGYYFIGASVREPHTREFNSGISLICVHICIICRMSPARVYTLHADDVCVI